MRRLVFVCLLVALVPRFALAQSGVYEGAGEAIMGSNMTPDETEQLAFEKARRNALQKFGAEVRSAKALQRASSSAGSAETLEEKIAVIAAGNTSLVGGSKNVEREPTEAAVRYTVTARFQIDPPNFERTLKAYQNAGRSSDLRESISTTLDLQDRMTQVEGDAGPQEVSELLQKTKKLYDAVAAYGREVDPGATEKETDQKTRRRMNAVARYFSVILESGFPGDVMNARVRRPETRGTEGKIEVDYRTRLKARNFQPLKSSCSQGASVWERQEERVSEQLPTLEKKVRLFLLDENGDVVMIMDKKNQREGRGPILKIDYGSCSPRHMFDHYNFDGLGSSDQEITWKLYLPTSWYREIEEVVLGFAKDDYEEVAKENGYELSDGYVWAQPHQGAISIDAFLYTREDFQQEILRHRSTHFPRL